ncbi:MAG: CrcB family protein [Pseudolysinimonas sp.]
MTALLVTVVLVAGALGALARYLVTRNPARSPWTVLIVNVAGSLIAGLAVGLTGAGVLPVEARLALVTGFAGGLTTFSTLSVETVQLFLTNRWRSAVASMAANLILGLTASALGWLIGLALFG